MIYIEAPVGVGFSYSSSESPVVDYQCSDDTAAEDNMAALKDFFSKFPEYKQNEFFLSGESYSGVYTPTLAEAIVLDADWQLSDLPALKGIAVGNGCSGTEVGICGWGSQGEVYTTKYLMQSAFIPDTLKDSLNFNCNFKEWFDTGTITSAACEKNVLQLDKLTQKLDTYCVYCDCAASNNSPHSKIHGVDHMLLEGLKSHPEATKKYLSTSLKTTACINSVEASAYLNRDDVRSVMHVEPAKVIDWSVCGTAPGWKYTSTRPNLPRDT